VKHAPAPEGDLPVARDRRKKARKIDPNVSHLGRSERLVEFGIRPVQLSSSVKLAADILREEIFRIRKEGVFFGYEEALLKRLAVSRSTFRQAIRVLEHEQLLEVRRGVKGGLYTRHPTGEAVANFASIYLVSAKAKLRDVMLAIAPLRSEAVRLIADSGDIAARNLPAQYVERHEGFDSVHDYRIVHRVINGYNKLIAELCGNPVLTLFLEVMRRFANETRWDAAISTEEGEISEYVQNVKDQARAISKGDVSSAVRIAHQQAAILMKWVS